MSTAVVVLKWAMQQGLSVVPKAYSAEHIRENLQALQIPDLSEDDMRIISQVRADKGFVRFMDPHRYWGFDIFNEVTEEPADGSV